MIGLPIVDPDNRKLQSKAGEARIGINAAEGPKKPAADKKRIKERIIGLFWLKTLIVLPPWLSPLGWFLIEENRDEWMQR